MICKIYETGFLKEYKFVVVLSKYQGKLLLSRHKQRTTWETQGGHLEAGETPLEAAKRELYEESGAIEYDIAPLCDYWAGEPEETSKIDGSGMVFVADIYKLGTIPQSEMAEVCTFEKLPENLTYPDIVPVLYARAQREQKIIY
ncbi:MAG: NUDIX domain-containing protein [Lachnospiraceae bacterium]|nr:NUDIX domain-containing protein [Lachnospiraceae bacterium]